MRRVQKLLPILAVLAGTVLTTQAEARRSRREGLNFGTSLRLLDQGDRTTAGIGSDKNTKTTTNGQAITPYIGYAWESLNLGVSALAESQASEIVERSDDGTATMTRKSTRDTRGAALFARFLFGGVFFFEAAGGVYQEDLRVIVENKTKTDDEGNFQGDVDDDQVKGVGPGYHLGAGLELPMAGNFFFTSAYQFRMVTLRDHDGGANLGSKRSLSQKRELLFGIAYYDD